MFGDHGLCGLLEEGAHGKSPKCLDGNLGDFGEFCKGLDGGFAPSSTKPCRLAGLLFFRRPLVVNRHGSRNKAAEWRMDKIRIRRGNRLSRCPNLIVIHRHSPFYRDPARFCRTRLRAGSGVSCRASRRGRPSL